MAMRIQEIHPALVHFPIALLPSALSLDALGRITGDTTLLETGRRGIAVAASAAAVAAGAGLLAQEASEYRTPEARDLLVTHRNLNVGLVALTGWLAARRARRDRPSLSYLLVGFAGVAVMSYSAYMGGRMVYEHGVGVREANGLDEAAAPHLHPDEAGEVISISARHIVEGVKHTVSDAMRGQLLPWITGSGESNGTSASTKPVESRGGWSG